MKCTDEAWGIARNQAESAFPILRLKPFEKLSGEFEVEMHSQSHLDEFIHFIRSAYGQRCRTDARDCQVRPFPNSQAADGAPSECFVLRDRADDRRDIVSRC